MNQFKEFKEFIARRKPKTLSFLSENQSSYDVAEPCVLQLSFTNMLISENPGVIYLTNGENSMRLDRVKSVEIVEDVSPIGSLIKVFCKNPRVPTGVSSYIIIAS